jgi:hypothetical protein
VNGWTEFWLRLIDATDLIEFGPRASLALQAENDLGIGPMVVDIRMRRAA